MVRVFIVYGGDEGEKIGRQIEVYLKGNNIGAFLASPKSPEISPSEKFFERIDYELKNANLAIIVVTNGIHTSDPAKCEIERIQNELHYPYIPFVKKGVELPEQLKDRWNMVFDNDILSESNLNELELKMWRFYIIWLERQTKESMEGDEVLPTKAYGLMVK